MEGLAEAVFLGGNVNDQVGNIIHGTHVDLVSHNGNGAKLEATLHQTPQEIVGIGHYLFRDIPSI